MGGWSKYFLSQASKEILIKLVIQAISNYAMSITLFSKEFCKSLCAKIARFWWKGNEKEKGIHWIGWSKLFKPKTEGGIKFKNLYCMNRVMLAK